MMKTFMPLLLALTALPVIGIAPPAGAEAQGAVSPVEATWLYGRHTLPAKARDSFFWKTIQQSPGETEWTQVARAQIKPGHKTPVVLYLHGCTGWSKQDDIYRDLLVKEDYAVFMPDSFQRPGRQQCGKQGPLEERVAMRTEEVEYALGKIRELPWVDQDHVILMGYSEGGNTTDNWSRPGFAAHIIIGSACTLVGGEPAAPADVPVLAIVGEKDHYRPGQSCRIDRTIGGSRSIVIPGGAHWVGDHAQTLDAIKTFLRECCSG